MSPFLVLNFLPQLSTLQVNLASSAEEPPVPLEPPSVHSGGAKRAPNALEQIAVKSTSSNSAWTSGPHRRPGRAAMQP
eukprot:3671156-Pyramimonas_sp.AAC.1